jgi:hypothetical protein
MNLDKIKNFFSDLGKHDLPTLGAILVGIVLLFLLFRSGKKFTRVIVFLIAIGMFAGAWWWHNHK